MFMAHFLFASSRFWEVKLDVDGKLVILIDFIT